MTVASSPLFPHQLPTLPSPAPHSLLSSYPLFPHRLPTLPSPATHSSLFCSFAHYPQETSKSFSCYLQRAKMRRKFRSVVTNPEAWNLAVKTTELSGKVSSVLHACVIAPSTEDVAASGPYNTATKAQEAASATRPAQCMVYCRVGHWFQKARAVGPLLLQAKTTQRRRL
eukprot:2208226-Pleurochrysis_carterae.AAC.1